MWQGLPIGVAECAENAQTTEALVIESCILQELKKDVYHLRKIFLTFHLDSKSFDFVRPF